MPGTGKYKPRKYWYSVIYQELKLSSILTIYMYYERIHEISERKAWAKTHEVTTRRAYLGIKYAARKRRPPFKIAEALKDQ